MPDRRHAADGVQPSAVVGAAPAGPDGRRDVPAHYEWYLRIPGIVLLLAAAFVIVMSITELYLF